MKVSAPGVLQENRTVVTVGRTRFGVLGVGQVDMHVVGVDTDESRTFCGFFAGEVLIIHALYSSRYDRKYGS